MALGYHTVSAPTAGVVGDIPVRVGDRVTNTTPLTTIDKNTGLEVYINVPVQEAEHLKVGLPVHLVDDEGRLLDDHPADLRLALGRRGDAVGAGEGVARAGDAACAPSSTCARAWSGPRRRRSRFRSSP